MSARSLVRACVAGAATALAVAAAAGALAAPAAAGPLPDGSVYAAQGAMVTTVRWTQRSAGYPDPCAGWVEGRGGVRVRVFARGGFELADVPGVGIRGGMTSAEGGRLSVERRVRYRIHTPAFTPECVPCGPDTEFGPCAEEQIPDRVDMRSCSPASVAGNVEAIVLGGLLRISALGRSDELLRECSRLVPHGVAVGPPEPELWRLRFSDAVRRIARLAEGERTAFRRERRFGPGCRGRSRAPYVTCTTQVTSLIVTRMR